MKKWTFSNRIKAIKESQGLDMFHKFHTHTPNNTLSLSSISCLALNIKNTDAYTKCF